MDKAQQKWKNQKSRNLEGSNKKELFIGTIIATIIALSPMIFNLYLSVPEVKVWDTFLFTYDSKYYEDVSVVAWTLMNKLLPLLLLFIWFFTCRHWWYHTLIVPIIMYVFQIIVTLNGDLYFIDTNEMIYLLPIMAIIIPSIYLIRAKMFDKLNTANKTLEDLEAEFTVRPKTVWGKLKQYF